jgi:acetylornithine/N-succinyldiaminopimelate aminotransferase
VADVVRTARSHGLLLVGAGDNVVRLVPPLILSSADIAFAMDALEASARQLDDERA